MAVVKGSKQIKMVVVPHRPLRSIMLVSGILFVVLVIGLGTFYFGYNEGMDENFNVRQERDQLRIQIDSNIE